MCVCVCVCVRACARACVCAFIALWANSANNKLAICFFFIFPASGLDISCKFEMSNPVTGKNKKNILKCRHLKTLHRVLNVNLEKPERASLA